MCLFKTTIFSCGLVAPRGDQAFLDDLTELKAIRYERYGEWIERWVADRKDRSCCHTVFVSCDIAPELAGELLLTDEHFEYASDFEDGKCQNCLELETRRRNPPDLQSRREEREHWEAESRKSGRKDVAESFLSTVKLSGWQDLFEEYVHCGGDPKDFGKKRRRPQTLSRELTPQIAEYSARMKESEEAADNGAHPPAVSESRLEVEQGNEEQGRVKGKEKSENGC